MPIPDYSVLIGRVSDRKFATASKNHYEIRVEAAGASYRIAINVQSQDGSEVLYDAKENFQHAMLTPLVALGDGRHPLASQSGGVAIDFIRGPFAAKDEMTPLPAMKPGDDNDLNDRIDALVQHCIADATARVYAFGSFFKDAKADPYFNFKPGQGIHDVHMNQGNDPGHKSDDGIWRDGALLFHAQQKWTAVFLAFKSQSWTTDAQGHATSVVVIPSPGPGTGVTATLRIIAALANSKEAVEVESVTLLNPTPDDVDLSGWKLTDSKNNAFALNGKLAAGNTARITIAAPMQLSNKGDTIKLLDPAKKIVHNVTYTKDQASKQGWTIVF